ncbi:uncharacterized protein Z519_07112 [Cladophialophora bantiana CBS 173.52]|uniref:Uncharacterized protein n=1 Tax=Cladophialophora bantiana (strain ATCC 10958 / CBS 173.52 / CDC B-1940 / NIH 8579) TaxID=1442370 RepID=A0A0D2HFT8_CLAB1|nr:uncharacterized protein Z519_07112 [Cladophialophora bantiana CBS 173.52]KIW92128.1 hypothetical protein Z519_07112 [Cladophialophora bantiana CBS 173.52]
MVSVLVGDGRREFRKYCGAEEWPFTFSTKHKEVVRRLENLQRRLEAKVQCASLEFVLKGFDLAEGKRPTAAYLFNQLKDMPSFVGECCAVPASGCGLAGAKLSLSPTQKASKGPVQGSVLRFIITVGEIITKELQAPSIKPSLGELAAAVERQEVQSLRSAETKLLFYIVSFQCHSADECLTLSRLFVNELSDAAKCPTNSIPLYDKEGGEIELACTIAYLSVLVDRIPSRCMTGHWNKTHDAPTNEHAQPQSRSQRDPTFC